MAIYRALKALDTGKRVIPRGALVSTTDISDKAAEILLAKGKVAHVSAPPLSALPGWKTRAAKFEKVGISNAEQFLEASEEELRKAIKAKPELIAKWKQEIIGWLTVPEPHYG